VLDIWQELRDLDEGSEFPLRLLFSTTVPHVFCDEHAGALAVGSRSFFVLVFE
jgi:hypothetical protein